MLVLLYFTSMSESRFGVIIFVWSNQDEWDGLDMWQVWGERSVRVLVVKPEAKRLLGRPDIEGTIILQLNSTYPD